MKYGSHVPLGIKKGGTKIMAQQNNSEQHVQNNAQDQVTVKGSTFADGLQSKRTPVQNALQKPLKDATGDLFKLISGTDEKVKTKDGADENRAVYKVQPLNSALLPISTEFEVKIKGSKCIVDEKDNVDLMLGARIVVVAFDNLSHWVFNGVEGLNASGIRVLQLDRDQVVKIVRNGNHG